MRVWVIKTGEPLPYLVEEADERFLRAGQVARAAAVADHQVVWWNARFFHQKKHYRTPPENQLLPGQGGAPDVVLLGSRGYTNHLGLRRFLDHRDMARSFRRLAPTQPEPDVIFCAWPVIDLCAAAVDFGKARGIPVVLDVRDLWPDVIYEKLNTRLPFRTNGAFLPYEIQGRRAIRGAAAISGLTQGMLDWARGRFGGSGPDRVFHQCMTRAELIKDIQAEASAFWASKGVDLEAPMTRLVWSGSLIQETDGAALLEALEQLPEAAAREIQVVLCGTGALVPRIQETAARLPHLIYGGWVDAPKLTALTEASHIGLLCYLDRFDFRNSVPNKVVDYCAAAMRVLTNLGGEVPRLLGDSDSVISYPTGDATALAQVLGNIAADPVRYRVKHAPSRAVFDEHFDAEKVLPGLISWLEDIANTDPVRP